jgi:predicted RecA/RadA family phage recombinase
MSQTPAIYIQEGSAIDHTPGSDVSAGDVVVLDESLVTIAKRDIPSGKLGALATSGVFAIPKVNGAIDLGKALYWDDDANPQGGTVGTGALTTNAALGPFAGWAIAAAGANDERVTCYLRSFTATDVSGNSLGDLANVDSATPTSGHILIGDGSDWANNAVSGDGTLSDAGVLAITGFAAMPTIPAATVAAAGTDQTDAAAIATGFTLVTAADGDKGVILPTAAAGKVCILKNSEAAQLKVWPGTDDKINGGTATTGQLTMANSTAAIFIAYDATDWYTLPLLPS